MSGGGVAVGTEDGVFVLTEGALERVRTGDVRDLHAAGDGWWAVEAGSVSFGSLASPELTVAINTELHAVLPAGNGAWVGGAEATLFRAELAGDSLTAAGDAAFMSAPGRDGWYTPWGGPPDVRSLALGSDGTVYLNVHVGGILRQTAGSTVWDPCLDVDLDVHEVAAHPTEPGLVAAATAYGLFMSGDGGDHWDQHTEGLHASYCRAVILTGDRVFVSASTGPGGRRAALYRMLRGDGALTRCETGLPEWFSTNLNTRRIAVAGNVVYAGDTAGTVYGSDDGGVAWSALAEGLPRIRCVRPIPEAA